jgi:hypothetical protein
MILEHLTSLPQACDLGMGAGIKFQDVSVVCRSHDLTFFDDDCPDGNFI